MRNRQKLQYAAVIVLIVVTFGCQTTEKPLHYLGEHEIDDYRDAATSIDYPCLCEETAPEVAMTAAPHTIRDRQRDEIWNMTLVEALHIALSNSRIVRNESTLSSNNPLLTSSEFVASVYDPAIQESGVLFGRRGVEAALAAFDTQFTTSMIWGRDEQVQNNFFFGGGLTAGNTLVGETGTFTSELRKQFGHGGAFTVRHNWDYLGSNVPGVLFRSAYTGFLGMEYRHPLWAGAGTEFTRIAGPIAQSFGGITGVSQGVVIARINQDLSLADFELAVQDMLRDVEQHYWNLYLSYRVYDTAIAARNSALETWRNAKAKLDIGGVAGFDPADEAQARDRFFETRAQVEGTLTAVYAAETNLRRLIGLPVNDGRVIRPADEPISAEFIPDWQVCLTEALTRRVELRKKKWDIKSLELQLRAAESLINPRLDFVSGYRVNAFGDQLFGEQDNDGVTPQGLRSAYETLTQGNQTGWQLGFEFTMPLGFRSARTQVRNYELRLAKAREILAAQELDVSHQLAYSFQSLAEKYATAQSNFNRRRAAEDRLQKFQAKLELGTATVDEVVRAQESLANAEVAYFTSLVEYNQQIAQLHYRKGTLLDHNGVVLSEGEWCPDAYDQAYRRAEARAHAFDAPWMHAEPEEFVMPGDYTLSTPEATPVLDVPLEPETDPELPLQTPPKPAVEYEEPLPPPRQTSAVDDGPAVAPVPRL